MAVLNGWINGLDESHGVKNILNKLNIENGIISHKVFMNGEIGCQFYINHNHAGFSFELFFDQLKEIVSLENKELHGLIYYYNDEDSKYFDSWQVWVIRQGQIEKQIDNFLSPYSDKVAIYDDELN